MRVRVAVTKVAKADALNRTSSKRRVWQVPDALTLTLPLAAMHVFSCTNYDHLSVAVTPTGLTPIPGWDPGSEMNARVGPTLFNHFGWIHTFSVLTIVTVPRAYFAIKRGDVESHKRHMIGLYFGALIIAGGFTFFPGRYLYQLFFG